MLLQGLCDRAASNAGSISGGPQVIALQNDGVFGHHATLDYLDQTTKSSHNLSTMRNGRTIFSN